MAPQYLNNNHVTYYVLRNNVSRRSIVPRRLHAGQWYVITSDVTWTPRQSERVSPSQINSQSWCPKLVLSIPVIYNMPVRATIGLSPLNVTVHVRFQCFHLVTLTQVEYLLVYPRFSFFRVFPSTFSIDLMQRNFETCIRSFVCCNASSRCKILH